MVDRRVYVHSFAPAAAAAAVAGGGGVAGAAAGQITSNQVIMDVTFRK